MTAATLVFCGSGLGQSYDTTAQSPQITATGRATLDATADRAQVRFIVECETNDVAAGQSAVNNGVSRAFAALENVGVNREAIRASAIDVMPIYTDAGGKDVALNLTGFRAKAGIDVDLQAEQLNHVGTVVDAVMKTGGTRLDGITFNVSPGSPQRTAVIRQATQDAQTKARAMAAALGVQIASMEGAG
ncbi:MAG TPA: SIMPL domain-containing protein, partial [Verrucomicrobiae bacterium]|nr:SIMPL domain-containing protein [Verrucomicrobiae bacterium]